MERFISSKTRKYKKKQIRTISKEIQDRKNTWKKIKEKNLILSKNKIKIIDEKNLAIYSISNK